MKELQRELWKNPPQDLKSPQDAICTSAGGIDCPGARYGKHRVFKTRTLVSCYSHTESWLACELQSFMKNWHKNSGRVREGARKMLKLWLWNLGWWWPTNGVPLHKHEWDAVGVDLAKSVLRASIIIELNEWWTELLILSPFAHIDNGFHKLKLLANFNHNWDRYELSF